jgi:hypothetical protein
VRSRHIEWKKGTLLHALFARLTQVIFSQPKAPK